MQIVAKLHEDLVIPSMNGTIHEFTTLVSYGDDHTWSGDGMISVDSESTSVVSMKQH